MNILFLLLAIALFIALVLKNVPIVIATILSSIFLLLTQQMDLYDGITATYMTGFGDYVRDFFLLFMLGALFGKLVEISGAANSISTFIFRAFGDRFAIIGLIIMGIILTLGGVNLFVAMFTMYPLAMAMFRRMSLISNDSTLTSFGNTDFISIDSGAFLSSLSISFTTVSAFSELFSYSCFSKLTVPWSEKNIREQAFVTEYIGGCLRERGVRFTLEGPYTATAGELAHLKTDIRLRLSSVEALGDILQALHPTPAVCGLPKEEAFRFILSHEGYDRSYYAGFLGRWEPEGKTALYVNLRCMQCGEGAEKIRLYAGGGILPASVCEEEWMETERKLQTMKYVISKGGTDVFG